MSWINVSVLLPPCLKYQPFKGPRQYICPVNSEPFSSPGSPTKAKLPLSPSLLPPSTSSIPMPVIVWDMCKLEEPPSTTPAMNTPNTRSSSPSPLPPRCGPVESVKVYYSTHPFVPVPGCCLCSKLAYIIYPYIDYPNNKCPHLLIDMDNSDSE